MKVFVTGALGQLGHDVVLELNRRGFETVASDIRDDSDEFKVVGLDITNRNDVEKTLTDICPDAIIHCAAWTDVDGAEDSTNQTTVRKINVDGTQNIAAVAKKIDAKMIYISTDYVFNGEGTRPWEPDDKVFEPKNYYGETKLDGELAVANTLDKFFIVRIAWVFGKNGKNFVDTMLRVGSNYEKVRVVDDQIGTPTYCKDLARLLVDMVETDKYGFYHATNEGGYISWADFAKEIFRQAGYKTKVVPVTTEEYGVSKAVRPKNSRLNKSKLSENGFKLLPIWQEALEDYMLAKNNKEKND